MRYKMKTQIRSIILMFILSAAAYLPAQIKLPAVVGDNMVIQRDTMVNIWGWAAPNAKISVSGSCMKAPASAVAGKDGKWSANFESLGAGGPYTLAMKDNSDGSTVELKNILCGEVWLCSGQSNMGFTVARVDNAKQEIDSANYPNIRLFNIPTASSPEKQTDVKAAWVECTPESVSNFSAVGYFFGRNLHTELNIPVGLINSSWGGSIIEAWIPTEGYEGLGLLDNILGQIKQKTPGSPEYTENLKKAIESVQDWRTKAVEAMKNGTSVPDLPAVSLNLMQGNHGIQGLFNAMIHPIIPYTIKGAIWYQGESNLLDGMLYSEKMKALIGGWRKLWGVGEFPFYYVHLAPYKYSGINNLPYLWEAQLYALNIPNTGMAVTNDIGNFTDIHPTNKQDVGKRLSLWALAKDYGKDIVYSGPLYKSVKFQDGKAYVTFDHSGSGLATRDGKTPDSFEIAGGDNVFHAAQAKIEGKDTVVVWSDKVTDPKVVRLGWTDGASPNLINKEGLPTASFSSDIEIRTLPKGKNLALNKPYECSNTNLHGSAWRQGLTNGNWGEDALNCFATNEETVFPKYATIDLGKIETVSKVHIGVPSFGSTKTVQIELSTDGKDFKYAGQYVFSQKKSERKMISFNPAQARYVRVVYPDYYTTSVNYSVGFMFTTEVEVYSN